MVEAVPMVLQVPGELQIFCSIFSHSSMGKLPAIKSGAQRKGPVPLPKRSPLYVAPIVKPAGQ